MCGRYNLRTSPKELAEFFELTRCDEFAERFNVAPTQTLPILRVAEDGNRIITPMRWGLIPSWAKDIKIGYKLINARSETVSEKPSFRSAWKRRRCLVPATGFYEWVREGKQKLPFHIHREDNGLFTFGGLWETWHENGGELDSFTILTTSANSLMSPIHDRMPVLIEPNQYDVWLDHDVDTTRLKTLFAPFEWNDFVTTRVSEIVNNARNETPECIEPVE